jgi:hypothetical protein
MHLSEHLFSFIFLIVFFYEVIKHSAVCYIKHKLSKRRALSTLYKNIREKTYFKMLIPVCISWYIVVRIFYYLSYMCKDSFISTVTYLHLEKLE